MPLYRALCALFMKLIGQDYRFFLHDPLELLEAATGAGHAVMTTYPVGVWQVVQLRLPRLERPLPTELPEGIKLNAQKVSLGNGPTGVYVGLVERRRGRGNEDLAAP